MESQKAGIQLLGNFHLPARCCFRCLGYRRRAIHALICSESGILDFPQHKFGGTDICFAWPKPEVTEREARMGGTPSSARGKKAALKIQGTLLKEEDLQDSTGPIPAKRAPKAEPPQATTSSKPHIADSRKNMQLSAQLTPSGLARPRAANQNNNSSAGEHLTHPRVDPQQSIGQRDKASNNGGNSRAASVEVPVWKPALQPSLTKKKEQSSADVEETERKLKEQEDASLEMMAAQRYKAFEAEQDRKRKEEERRCKLQEQEDLSIDQMDLQQYKAYEAKMQKQMEEATAQQATAEADAMLDQFAPPKKKDSAPVPKKKRDPEKKQEIQMSDFCPDSGLSEDRDEVSEIVANKIYLTNHRGAENVAVLQERNIKHIVCVNSQENGHPDKFHYFNIDSLEDQEDHDATEHFSAVKKAHTATRINSSSHCLQM